MKTEPLACKQNSVGFIGSDIAGGARAPCELRENQVASPSASQRLWTQIFVRCITITAGMSRAFLEYQNALLILSWALRFYGGVKTKGLGLRFNAYSRTPRNLYQ